MRYVWNVLIDVLTIVDLIIVSQLCDLSAYMAKIADVLKWT